MGLVGLPYVHWSLGLEMVGKWAEMRGKDGVVNLWSVDDSPYGIS